MSNRRLVPLNVYASASEPAGSRAGDMYFNTTTSKTYVYDGSAWIVAGGAGGGVTASETVPENPEVGSGWFNTATGNLYIYYDSYWVEVGANGGMPGPTGIVTASSPLVYDADARTLDLDQTGLTISESQVTNLTTDLAAKATDADLTAHESATTNVHGIADTSLLATESYADTAASTAASARVSKTGDTITGDLDVSGALTGSVVSGKDPEEILREAVWWIDAAHAGPGQTVPNLGWGGSALDAQLGSSGSADSNDPKYLDWSGENYVYLAGGNQTLSVDDSVALSITGDLDVAMRLAPDTWTDALFLPFIAKRTTTGNQYSWVLFANSTTPKLRFAHSADGASSASSVTSTADLPFSDGAAGWIRVTLDVDNGASGHDVRFYYAADQQDVPTSWTQLGATVTTAGTTSIFDGTAPVTAMYYNGTSSKTGKVHRYVINDGIGGTPVLDVDCSQITSGADTSFTALTGQTVTINRSTSGRKTVGVVSPRWLFGTDDYMQVADNDLIDFGASDSFTVLAVVRQWATPFNFSYPFGKHNDGVAGYYLRNNGTGTSRYAGISDGTNQAITTADYVDYTLGQVSVAGIRLDRSSQELSSFNGSDISTAASTSAVGSLANSLTFRVGNRSAGGFFTDAEFTAAAIWRRALTSGEIATLNSYFQGRA